MMPNYIILLLLFFFPFGKQDQVGDFPQQLKVKLPNNVEASLLYSDDFENDLSQWVVEQRPGGIIQIKDGYLDIDDAKGCTVWFKEKLAGPILIEYDATMIDRNGINDRVSDLNCFFMATDPENPDDLFANKYREGSLSDYFPMRLYYVEYGGNNNTTTRFQRYPGNGRRPLLPEYNLERKIYMNQPNKTVNITVIADSAKIKYYREGQIIFFFLDESPFLEGWFGFRTVKSHTQIDNFRVFQLQELENISRQEND